jgi:hypothetical protein
METPKKQIKLTPNKQTKTYPMFFWGISLDFKKPEQHDFDTFKGFL